MLELQSRPAFLVSAAAVLAAVIGIGATMPPIVRAVVGPSAEARSLDDALERQVLAHAEAQTEYASRFNGRSAFYTPKIAPPARPRPEPERTVREDPAPSEPVVVRPRTYSGPGIKAFDGEKVWFADGKLLGVGEEADGLKVLAVNAPWSAQVAYQGWEGEVTIFPTFDPSRVFRDALGSRTPGIRETTPAATPPAAGSATAAPGAPVTPPKRDPEIPDE